ncbi:MAG: glucan biosynthesis protein G [Rubrivivax sp.]
MFRFLLIAAVMLPGFLCAAGAAAAFGLEDVATIARQSAAAPYRDTGGADATVPAELNRLGYDAMREIRWRPERALWRDLGLPFELQFFHVGGGHQPVQISQIVDGAVHPLRHDPADWTFGKNRIDASVVAGLGPQGLAGFRVHTALNASGVKDELIVFLGASYFRAIGRNQVYGLSARALAIDTVGAPPARGEEFPRFTTFWIERPGLDATELVIYALLDSPSAAGAYRFTVRPGTDTTVDVQQRLYLRAAADRTPHLGIAPLSSMYAFGENQPQPHLQNQPNAGAGDFRPEVHDSDGLMLQADGESLWRPLVNPVFPSVSSFAVRQLQGFGLMQRDRRFASYEDDEAHYERRPSAWVEPLGDWGAGRIELLQLPTPDETHDNIVAYWVPTTLPAGGEPLVLAYRLHWQGDLQRQPAVAHVVQSRRGIGWKAAGDRRGDLQFIVDFEGSALADLPADAPVQAVASAALGARITAARAWRHPISGWRMQLRVQRDDRNQPTELRAYLRLGSDALTETWAALVPAEPLP